MPTYTFTQEDAQRAYEEWGCNCGPAALAFALQTTLYAVRHAIPKFDERRYTSPTMMRQALQNLGRSFTAARGPFHGERFQRGLDAMFAGPMKLVRIQWTGPWTGKVQKWAARQTHWIAAWYAQTSQVFDVNGGIRTFQSWQAQIVPAIVAEIKRADGGWYPANIWEVGA